jgi:DNA topoisomerase-1
MRLLFQLFSTEIMLRKEILTVKERKYTQLVLQSGKLEEKLLKENTGSDKGKLVPTDIGTIVTDFLVKNFGIY